MGTLENFPMVSQLTTVTGDGRPSENAQFDCVAASIDAATRWLLGKPENSVFNPDHFKDVAYGEALRNSGTSASAYVAFCKSLGVHLFPLGTADYVAAVQQAHVLIQHGFPVIFTRDDPYVDRVAHPDWTHVCVFFGEDGSGLTALDPYIGRSVYKTDAGWESVLRNSELWIAERIEEIVTIDIHNPEIAKHFKELDAHQWQSIATGKIIHDGLLGSYKGYGNRGLCGWDFLGEPRSNEITIGAGKVKQHYERGVMCWDNGRVYPLSIYDDGPGTDPRIAELTATVADLRKQLTAAPNNTAVQTQLDAANAKLAQFKALALAS